MQPTPISIHRWYQSDVTLGRLRCGDFQCFTLELPFKENQSSISAVFSGLHYGRKRESPTNGHCIELNDQMGRTYIQIHAGNFVRHTEGCILVGDSIKIDKDGVPFVGNSASTLAQLLHICDDAVQVMISDR